MAVAEAPVPTKRKPLTKRWWLWAIVGLMLLFWLDACADEKLQQLEAETQQESRTLVHLQPAHASDQGATALRVST